MTSVKFINMGFYTYYANRKERRKHIVRMRERGMTLQEIADSMDPKVSRQAIHKTLKRHYAKVDGRRNEA